MMILALLLPALLLPGLPTPALMIPLIPPVCALSISVAETATPRAVIFAEVGPSGGLFRGPDVDWSDSAPGQGGERLRDLPRPPFEGGGRAAGEFWRCKAGSRPAGRSEAALRGIWRLEAAFRSIEEGEAALEGMKDSEATLLGIKGSEAALAGIGAREADLRATGPLVRSLRIDEHLAGFARAAMLPTRLCADNTRGRADPLDTVCDLDGGRLVSVSGDIPACARITHNTAVRFATANHSDVDLPATSRARSPRP
jgi:hypothetical protein